MKRWSIGCMAGAAIFAAAGAANAQFAGSGFTFSGMAGKGDLDDHLGLNEDKVLTGGRVGYILSPHFTIEGLFNTVRAPKIGADERIRFNHYGADLVFTLIPEGFVEPYVAGGWSQVHLDSGGEAVHENGFDVGGGLRFRLVEVDGLRWDLRLDAHAPITGMSTPFVSESAAAEDWHNQLLWTAGFQLSLPRNVKDTDGDGVSDRKDECPGTPPGAHVDEKGCPTDADGDGIFDGIDECPATPKGALVDRTGCPRDTDGDGVYDGIDRCARTPQGARVDARGCPKDSDGDGVYDGLDQCPNTRRGVEVDEKGCEVVTRLEKEMLDTGMIRLQNVRFSSGKSEIQPESFAALNEVGEILSKWRELKIEIGGHTDSQGSRGFNQRLSAARAEAVRQYLLEHFPAISPDQLTAKGYGEDVPIASNDTPEGRAANRRVEFKVMNRGVLERVK